MQSILVCDDDKQIVEAIDIYLTGEGFEVIKAYRRRGGTGTFKNAHREFDDSGRYDARVRWHPDDAEGA